MPKWYESKQKGISSVELPVLILPAEGLCCFCLTPWPGERSSHPAQSAPFCPNVFLQIWFSTSLIILITSSVPSMFNWSSSDTSCSWLIVTDILIKVYVVATVLPTTNLWRPKSFSRLSERATAVHWILRSMLDQIPFVPFILLFCPSGNWTFLWHLTNRSKQLETFKRMNTSKDF